ncbi:hypothetical protein VTK26DRAFT_5834 [Humicola hyalothermophila]
MVVGIPRTKYIRRFLMLQVRAKTVTSSTATFFLWHFADCGLGWLHLNRSSGCCLSWNFLDSRACFPGSAASASEEEPE